MNNHYLLGLKLSKFNFDLSKTETILCFKTYFEVEEFSCFDDILILKIQNTDLEPIKQEIVLHCLNRLAFAKACFIISNKNDWVDELFNSSKKFDKVFNFENTSFKIDILLPNTAESGSELSGFKLNLINENARAVLKNSFFQKISLSSPGFVFCVFSQGLKGLRIWSNKDAFNSRKCHLKPGPHPSGIDPRLAKAMINLASAKEEVLDPFCGAGGILEEVKLLGLKYSGVDISWKMINLARLNLKSKDDLFHMSAFSWDKKVECVVTDLPYGKNSKLDGTLDVLINDFFKHFYSLTDKIVVCVPNTFDVVHSSKINGWNLDCFFDIYMHNSLTRRIHVLSKP